MEYMEYIDQLYKEVREQAKALNLPISNNISKNIGINRRAKSRFGCCKKIKHGKNESFEIELSHRLLECEPKIIKQTLAHELIHTCEGCGNHGAIWQEYTRRMNVTYGYNIKRTETAEQLGIMGGTTKPNALPVNFLLICKKCGIEIARTRMSNVVKNPGRYRCKCGGKLERIK